MAALGLQRHLLSGTVDVVEQGAFYFGAKIEYGFISAFPPYADAVFPEADVGNIKADAFRNADAGAEEKRHNGDVPLLGETEIRLLLFGKSAFALLHIV